MVNAVQEVPQSGGSLSVPRNLRSEITSAIRAAMIRNDVSESELARRTEMSLQYLRSAVLGTGAINLRTLERVVAALEMRAIVKLAKRAA